LEKKLSKALHDFGKKIEVEEELKHLVRFFKFSHENSTFKSKEIMSKSSRKPTTLKFPLKKLTIKQK